jgi:F-type H+-transporting ATPase subunit b
MNSSRRRLVIAAAGLYACWMIFAMITSPPANALVQERSGHSLSPGQELTKEEREAAGEDGAAQFKHSAPVQWVSRLTGIGLEDSYLVMMGLNFLAVAAFIIWYSKKHLSAMFRNRTAAIQKAMEEARKTSAEANQRLAEIEARLSRLDAEIQQMRASAEQEAAAEEQRIKVAAEQDARKIVESVGQEITAAVKIARRDLTAYAADLAVALARKQIHVDAATDQNMVQHFARQLSNGDGPDNEVT